jgi:hypothetical protein
LQLQDAPLLTSLAGITQLEQLGGSTLRMQNVGAPLCEAEILRDKLIANGFRGLSEIDGLDPDPTLCAWPGYPAPPTAGVADCTSPAAIVISSDADVAQYAGVTCAANVLIEGSTTTVTLPNLVRVEDYVDATTHANTLTTLRLPALGSVGGAFLLSGGDPSSLTTLDLGRLETVTGAVVLERLEVLPELVLPRLNDVGGDARFSDTTASTVYWPNLEVLTGGLEVSWHEGMTTLAMPTIDDIGGAVVISNNAALVDLGTAGSFNNVGSFELFENESLASLEDLDVDIVYGDVTIRDNPLLWDLTTVDGDLDFRAGAYVNDNGCLSDDEALVWLGTTAAVTTGATGNNGQARVGCDAAGGAWTDLWPEWSWDLTSGGTFTVELGTDAGDPAAANAFWIWQIDFPDTAGGDADVRWSVPLATGLGFYRRLDGALDADAPIDTGAVGQPTHLRIRVPAGAATACGDYSLDGTNYTEAGCYDLSPFDVTRGNFALYMEGDFAPAAGYSFGFESVSVEPL